MKKNKSKSNCDHITQYGGYKIGDKVKLIKYHKDERPTTIRSTGQETCVLEDARAGYYGWNYFDIESAAC